MRNISLTSGTRRRGRRRGAARLFVLGSAFAASTTSLGLPAAAHAQSAQDGAAQRMAFSIPSGTIGSAAEAFAAATGIAVSVPNTDLRGLPSPGVVGTFTPRQALDRMLSGTGVGFEFSGDRAVTLDLRTAEFVAVEGRQRMVSSPKFTEALVDTPQSIAVISNEIFQQQGAQNLTDVLRNSPGITFNAGENGFASSQSNFTMRGFDTSGSIFIDGARDSGNYFRDVFNVEQVEVAKGPAADNGRGSAGGYINLTTKTPRAESFQRGSASFGFDEHNSDKRGRVALDVNQQLTAGAAVRLNALWTDGGVPGRSVAKKQNWGVAPSVALGLDGPTRALLSYQRVEQDDRPDWGVPSALIDGMLNFSPQAGGDDHRDLYYGHRDDYDHVTSNAVLARVEHDFRPTLRLSNQTRWSGTDREALYAVPTGYTPATRLVATQRQAYSRENSGLSNLTNLLSFFDTGSVRHALTSGVELTREQSKANRYPTNGVLGTPGNVLIESPDVNRPLTGLVGLVPLQTSDVQIDTVAAYAYDTVNFGSRWQLTGGLRLERYDVALESKTAAGAPQGPDGYSRDDVTIGGKVGLVFKPTEYSSVYGAVSASALPPASYLSNPDISRDGDNAFPGWSAGPNSGTSDPQRLTNYELGAKWNMFGERLNVTAATFRTHRENIAMAGTVNGVANQFAGYARQVVHGLDLGVAGNVTPAWAVMGGLLLMDSERQHGDAVDLARRTANPADYGTFLTTNGDELAFTPNVSATLWTTYQLPRGLTIGGGLQHVGESFLGRPDDAERIIPNGIFGVLPSYTVVNAMASYTVSRSLTLRLNVDNLANEFYAVSSNWPGTRVLLGPARSILLSTDFGF